MNNYFSKQTGFYGNSTPEMLVKEFGSPLYVYNEAILRQKCREMKSLVAYPNFKVTYSIKANSNLELLRIVREEGLHADAMSPGEMYILQQAGFREDEIFYISNNVSAEEMLYAIERGIMVSVDSISQLRLYGRLNPNGRVAIRFNPGVGAGHHEKVVTAGKKTKFGVNIEQVEEVKQVLSEYNLKLVGINQHIGSLFMEGTPYLESIQSILSLAEQFEDLEFVDFGGGFGIPYKKQEGQQRLELKAFGEKLGGVLTAWAKKYGKNIMFRSEPGRYIVAECGALLGTVYARKQNGEMTYVGTDLGFNVLVRPVMYDSHHDIEVYRNGKLLEIASEKVTVVGNICETGDIIAKDRLLPRIDEGDVLGVMDAGAYGFVMSSNYNMRLKPAELVIRPEGTPVLVRRRDTLEDLMRNYDIGGFDL